MAKTGESRELPTRLPLPVAARLLALVECAEVLEIVQVEEYAVEAEERVVGDPREKVRHLVPQRDLRADSELVTPRGRLLCAHRAERVAQVFSGR